MPDKKDGREKQARDADDRQRQRAIAEELERWDETEPEVDEAVLADVEEALADVEYPATGTSVVEVAGTREVEAPDGTYQVADLLPETDDETFESPAEVRTRVQRPTVAASMKRIVEANQKLNEQRLGSQRTAYEKSLRALVNVTPNDDDEGVEVLTDWIVGRIHEGDHPSSREVRRRAAKYCRENGYEVRDDEWLGA